MPTVSIQYDRDCEELSSAIFRMNMANHHELPLKARRRDDNKYPGAIDRAH